MPAATLEVVGRPVVPSYTEALHRFVDEVGLHDAVTFHGALSDAELAAGLAALRRARADVAARGLRRARCIEAMTLGVPVVANRVGALPEVVGDGGLLVDATDPYALAGAVTSVLGEPALRENLAQAAAAPRGRPRPPLGRRSRRRPRRRAAATGPPAEPRASGAPTACWTSETKRAVDAARSKPAARSRPAAARTAAQRRVPEHPGHGRREGHRRLVVEHQPGATHGLGHRGHAVGDDRDAVAHGLGQRARRSPRGPTPARRRRPPGSRPRARPR